LQNNSPVSNTRLVGRALPVSLRRLATACCATANRFGGISGSWKFAERPLQTVLQDMMLPDDSNPRITRDISRWIIVWSLSPLSIRTVIVPRVKSIP
jgi:hypothetical protein